MKIKIKTKKCQPAEGDTQDLIQTWCVPLRGLARPTKKNKQNEKNKTKKNSIKVTLAENDDTKVKKNKTKKCQPAEGDTQDLIQTLVCPSQRAGTPKQKK